jgi:hypothetical protein
LIRGGANSFQISQQTTLTNTTMKKIGKFWLTQCNTKGKALGLALIAYAISIATGYAQDGNAGINEASMRVRSYFTTGTSLMYAIGSIVGLVGAVKVYQKWNSGDPDTGKVAASWFGSCVFLVIVATVLRSFFGV